jgi:hypothetical protein
MNNNIASTDHQTDLFKFDNVHIADSEAFSPIYRDLSAPSFYRIAAERGREPPMTLVAITRSDPPRVDGPCHPYSWRLDGKTIGKMRTGSWKMVAYLWHQLDRAATYVDLLQPVYDDAEHVADANAFGSLCKAANKFFKEHRIPWRAGTKKAVVYLESAYHPRDK